MILLSLLGVLITSYLIYVHYKPVEDSLCSISDKMDCNSVNKSQYSGFFGSVGLIKLKYALGFDIPVALLGLLTYSILFILVPIERLELSDKIVLKTIVFSYYTIWAFSISEVEPRLELGHHLPMIYNFQDCCR